MKQKENVNMRLYRASGRKYHPNMVKWIEKKIIQNETNNSIKSDTFFQKPCRCSMFDVEEGLLDKLCT